MLGKVILLRVAGASLRGNLLGDPAERDLWVYLPPTYETTSKNYPLVVMLPGFGSNGTAALSSAPWKPSTIERLDALMVCGQCPEALIALPDCTTRFGGSQFIDSPVSGNYQTYLADDVLAALDNALRTLPTRDSRAIVGRSSGGFGALRMALDRPEAFSVIAAHAADANFEISMRPMWTKAAVAARVAGGWEALARNLADVGPRGDLEFDAAFTLASSQAYAAVAEPLSPHCTLPVSATTGVESVAGTQRWWDNDPLTLLSSRESLPLLRAAFVDAGQSDEHGLQYGAERIAQELQRLRVETYFELHPGGHRGTSHRYETSIPWVLRQLVTS